MRLRTTRSYYQGSRACSKADLRRETENFAKFVPFPGGHLDADLPPISSWPGSGPQFDRGPNRGTAFAKVGTNQIISGISFGVGRVLGQQVGCHERRSMMIFSAAEIGSCHDSSEQVCRDAALETPCMYVYKYYGAAGNCKGCCPAYCRDPQANRLSALTCSAAATLCIAICTSLVF